MHHKLHNIYISISTWSYDLKILIPQDQLVVLHDAREQVSEGRFPLLALAK